MKQPSSLRFAYLVMILMGALLAGCKPNTPPGPTEIPTLTVTPSPSVTPSGPQSPVPSLRPVVTATGLAPTPAPVVERPTDAPTAGPKCFTARQGDTVLQIITRAGYGDLAVWGEFCALNGMAPGCNVIQAGKEYCVPRQTDTPTPKGFSETATARASEIGNIGATKYPALTTYTIVKDDNIISVQLKTGVSLRVLCELNHPETINCSPPCKIDKPIGEQECRPVLKIGAKIRIPGPTATPTITPTLTGSETMTPTPLYSAPRLVAPVTGQTVSGDVQLIWLPVRILKPDERYLVLATDVTGGKNYEFETESTSVRLPDYAKPADGQPHTVNWQVGVARTGEDGSYVLVSTMSVIHTFVWQTQ